MRDGEVHVWGVSLNHPGLNESALSQLDRDERERAERIRSPETAARFATSRVVLRSILGRYLDDDPSRIRFSYGSHGKPELGEPYANALRFSLSRSGALALVAISSGSAVGVDVEQIDTELDADYLAQRFFSPRETARISRLNGRAMRREFLQYWVCKEAYLKATGEGLYRELNSFDVLLDPAPSLVFGGPDEEDSRWSLHLLPGYSGHAAALVAERICIQIRRFWYE